jgi:L-threonylcarbamoyladenylate synthase
MTLKLLKSLLFPLAAPSANPFGYVSPTEAAHVESHLAHVVPMILDGGPCGVGVESTIVDVGTFPVKILRLGGITVEQIEECINEKVEIQTSSSKPSAPGMLESHYAPRKPMFWHGDTPLVNNDAKTGCLSFEGNLSGDIVFELSSKGDLTEAAARLFQGMRWLDEQDIDRIEVKKLPEIGLGRAMNDRLNRACRS